jgi:hypothetical protein
MANAEPGESHRRAETSWQWNDASSPDDDARVDIDGCNYIFADSAIRASGDGVTWRFEVGHTLADHAALVVDGGRLYAALYRAGATGCRLLSLDAATGALYWDVALNAAGLLLHSKYANRVQLRVIDGDPVVFGEESAMRYVERRARGDGALISHRQERP